MTGLVYCDASALVKLVVPERESLSLRRSLRDRSERATSIVATVEVCLAARSTGRERDVDQAEALLATLSVIDLDIDIAERAGRLTRLRTPDAIHLATALSLGADLEAFIAYDRRLLDAAAAAGLPTLSPGVG